jgi:hypothetical protein
MNLERTQILPLGCVRRAAEEDFSGQGKSSNGPLSEVD